MQDKLFRKGLVVGIIFLFISIATAPSTANVINVNISTNNKLPSTTRTGEKTIYVDDDNTEGPWLGTLEYPFQYIVDGVNTANFGNTVYVFNGFYQEGYIQIKKTIKIFGEDSSHTIVDGNGHFWILILKSGGVKIKGFTFQNCDTHPYPADSAINIHPESRFNIISGNIFKNNNYAIWVWSSFNTISYNIIINNKAGIKIQGGFNQVYRNHIAQNGNYPDELPLFIQGPSNSLNIIKENNFIDNKHDVYFYFSWLNLWYHNYWDDWGGTGPKWIKGIIGQKIVGWEDGMPIYENVEGYNLDWRPASEPYDI
jgi:parallel beta-helix repeat protein